MAELWTSLLPLIVGSAVVPIQLVMTLLLLRSRAGRIAAVAFVAGMTVVRAAQGIVFGLVLSSSDAASADAASEGPGPVVSTVLLVVGVLFLVTALRQVVGEEDPDAPPPKWLTLTDSMTPARAFLLGLALLAIGVKFWVFTLGAIATIGDADLGQPQAALMFVVFVVLAESLHLVVLAVAFAAPTRSQATLEAAAVWLRRHNSVIVTVIGVVFGVWFVLEGLDGLGVL